MPYISVKTNISVSKEKQNAVKTALGRAVCDIPGKSEAWLMVGVEPESPLWFKGEDSPCAMVDVSVYGEASYDACSRLTGDICKILESELAISPSRVYVKYFETEKWGFNGSNF